MTESSSPRGGHSRLREAASEAGIQDCRSSLRGGHSRLTTARGGNFKTVKTDSSSLRGEHSRLTAPQRLAFNTDSSLRGGHSRLTAAA